MTLLMIDHHYKMYRSFVIACLLGVLVKEAYADIKEKTECIRNMARDYNGLFRKFSKIRTCPEFRERMEDLYENFEECSISGHVMDSLDAFVEDFCAPDSKMMHDLVSGKACWPHSYPLEMLNCAVNFLATANVTGSEDKCPPWKPLLKCLINSANKLCEGKSVKLIYRLIEGMEALINGLCDSLFETTPVLHKSF